MKKLIRIVVLVAALAAAAWLIRDRLVPAPEPLDEVPHFRRPPPPPPAPAPDPVAAPPPATAPPPADDLTQITGIGPKLAARLAEQGITSFATLAEADAEALAGSLAGASQSQIEGWIGQARERG